MTRALRGSGALVLLAVVACKGHEVTVFDMPMQGGSAGAAGSTFEDGGMAGATASSGGGAGASAGDAVSGSDAGVAGVAGTGATSGAGSGGVSGAAGMLGAGGSPPVMPCAVNEDCSVGWFCEKSSCEATSGSCVPNPVFLSPEPEPVCGCNGVTYWNDDIRRWFGVTIASIGECGVTACACEVGADCDAPYASCSHIISGGELCGHGPGACWVLPPKCVPTGDPMQWRECRPPDSQEPSPPCVDTCQAIRSERPHVAPHHDECK